MSIGETWIFPRKRVRASLYDRIANKMGVSASGKEKIGEDFTGKHILSLSQFDQSSLDVVFKQARRVKELYRKRVPSDLLCGRIVSLLILEPSTRTRLSNEAAIKRLGGGCISITDTEKVPPVSSSAFERMVINAAACSDVIVIRHPEIGSADRAAEISQDVPVINAGDGANEHPTQTLQDLLTIYDHCHRLSNIRGLVAGDPKNGRTVHSLLEGLAMFPGNQVDILALPQFQLPNGQIEYFREKGLGVNCIENPSSIRKDRNFWYWTRMQWERTQDSLSEEEKRLISGTFTITPEFLRKHKSPDTIILHPGPRREEISVEIDKDPCAVYPEKQVKNGLYTRMALIALVSGKAGQI